MKNRMISYGYEMSGGRITIADEESKWVKYIFSEYSKGRILAEIAEEIKRHNVEFYIDNYDWNKNKISRIIENRKYIGEDGYPPILSKQEFDAANDLKKGKGFKKRTFGDDVEYLRKNIVCAQCGRAMTRIAKWKRREKWLCRNGCKNSIYLDDKTVFDRIESIVNRIKEDPNVLYHSKSEVLYTPDYNTIKYKNELRLLMETDDPSFSVGKQLILKLADLKFQACRTDKQSVFTEKIIEIIRTSDRKNFNDFFNKTVKNIKVGKDGSITIKFINGSEISSGTEVNYASAGTSEKKDNNENRSQSADGVEICGEIGSSRGGVLPCFN